MGAVNTRAIAAQGVARADAQARGIVGPYCQDGETVELQLVTNVVWGTPLTLTGSPRA
jgi:hypothetical protein